MSTRALIPTALVLVALAAAACSSGGAAASPSAVASGSGQAPTTAPASAEPSFAEDAIEHPTGATDIVLRLEETGGFVPIEWLAARVPPFTLYGDGTVVFQQTTAMIEPGPDGAVTGQPIRTAKLTEEQVQELLAYALGDGGLAVAKPEYNNMMVADASTTVFTVAAEGDTKTVSAYGLGFEGEPGPDTAVLKQLATLAERLRDFDRGGTLPSDPYEADNYRVTITEQQGVGGVTIRAWPWEDLTPADFTFPEDPAALQQGSMVMTPEQVEVLGVEGYQNGIVGGVYVEAPDNTVYSVVVRPLLPGETA